MATYGWTGSALADGTVITSANLNNAGNGDPMVFQALVGGATRVARRDSNGNGFEISGTTVGDSARTDTATIVGGSACMAISGIYRAPSALSTAGNYFALGRNANATPASSGNIQQTASGFIEGRTASDVVATSSVAGSAATCRTPALTGANYYDFDFALIVNTSATPTTTNGRILMRVVALNEPNWVSSGVNEFWFDSGYTTNVSDTATNLWRTGKVLTTGSVTTFRLLGLQWRDVPSPNTSLTKSSAITNFVTGSAPILTVAGGAYYVITGTGAGAGGDTGVTYSISAPTGAPTVTSVGGSNSGIWRLTQDSNPWVYTVTATGVPSGATTTSTITAPAAVAATSTGQFRVRRGVGGALV